MVFIKHPHLPRLPSTPTDVLSQMWGEVSIAVNAGAYAVVYINLYLGAKIEVRHLYYSGS